ncbi:MAG: 50S ribosomal protein L9 [Candidatus Latescibacteria bacterium]|nr:50S ribosomal protein L9 [Candidatus Latescibacterota bacterium]
MKVILLRDVDQVGQAGEVVQVAPGYGRNFLIPNGQAMVATDANVAQFESRRKQHAAVTERESRDAVAQAKGLEEASLTTVVRVGEEDRLFGSVTAQNIADLLAQNGYEVDRRKIELEEPIRALGVYNISIRLHPEVVATVKLWVVKE